MSTGPPPAPIAGKCFRFDPADITGPTVGNESASKLFGISCIPQKSY